MQKLLKILGFVKEVRINVPISKNELVLVLQQVTHHADISLPKYMDEHLPLEKKFVGFIDNSGFTIRPKNLDKFRIRAQVDLITGSYVEQNGSLHLLVSYSIINGWASIIHYSFALVALIGFMVFVAYKTGIAFLIFSPIFIGFTVFAYYLLVLFPMKELRKTFEKELLTMFNKLRKS